MTNEPPSGLKANLIRAFCSFSPEFVNEVEPKTRAILFGLCHFHAILIERKKFGSVGYNIMYVQQHWVGVCGVGCTQQRPLLSPLPCACRLALLRLSAASTCVWLFVGGDVV